MRYYNMFDLKLQELYVFITVAEYQSITKAADFLYLTPSQVSKVIKKLEYQWGILLFIRDKNALRLTPAGKHAYEGLKETLLNVRHTIEESSRIQEVRPLLRIGCPTLSEPDELFVPIIEQFVRKHPHTSITIECKDTFSALRQMLILENVDLIYTMDIELQENPETFQWRAIEELSPYIIMNPKNPLSFRDNLELKDLEFEEFVFTSPTSSLWTDYVIQLCRENGFSPRIGRYVPNIYSQLMEVHINPNTVCIQLCKGAKNDKNLCYRRLEGIRRKMGFACRKDASDIITEFVECAVKCMTK